MRNALFTSLANLLCHPFVVSLLNHERPTIYFAQEVNR